jgi:hypothetical protein
MGAKGKEAGLRRGERVERTQGLVARTANVERCSKVWVGVRPGPNTSVA